MRKGRRGFTLIELLVVIVIISILAFALAMLVVELITRAKYDKTHAIVKSLSSACTTYRTKFKEFPPTSPYTGSANLHYYCGRRYDEKVSESNDGTKIVTRKADPILEFKRDWLEGDPIDTDPGTSPRQVKDPFGNMVSYSIDADKKDVSIRSAGADKVPNNEDDVHNKQREY